jgi:hypothetical protein
MTAWDDRPGTRRPACRSTTRPTPTATISLTLAAMDAIVLRQASFEFWFNIATP